MTLMGTSDGGSLEAAAIIRGNEEMARLLLDRGANVNLMQENGKGPLHSACRFGGLDMIKLLLGRGTDVEAADRHGKLLSW